MSRQDQLSSPGKIQPKNTFGPIALIGLIVLFVGCGATLSFLFQPDTWYSALLKPTWQPPSWIFGPVWTALYIIMAVAVWLVLRETNVDAAVRMRAMWLFGIQFLLNLLWTPIFFGLHRPLLAFIEICLLWMFLLSALLSFGKIRALSGYLLAPCLIWCTFALVLNGTLWLMNS